MMHSVNRNIRLAWQLEYFTVCFPSQWAVCFPLLTQCHSQCLCVCKRLLNIFAFYWKERMKRCCRSSLCVVSQPASARVWVCKRVTPRNKVVCRQTGCLKSVYFLKPTFCPMLSCNTEANLSMKHVKERSSQKLWLITDGCVFICKHLKYFV